MANTVKMKQFEAKYLGALELKRRHHHLRDAELERNHMNVLHCQCLTAEAYRALLFSLTEEQIASCREALRPASPYFLSRSLPNT